MYIERDNKILLSNTCLHISIYKCLCIHISMNMIMHNYDHHCSYKNANIEWMTHSFIHTCDKQYFRLSIVQQAESYLVDQYYRYRYHMVVGNVLRR